MVTFTALDITDEESVGDTVMKIDNCIQYGESMEVRDRYPEVHSVPLNYFTYLKEIRHDKI